MASCTQKTCFSCTPGSDNLVYPSCTLTPSEAFIFSAHRPCTPARVRYTTKGTRKIRVPLRVPLRVPFGKIVRTPETPYFKGPGGSCTLAGRFEEPTTVAGHFVKIPILSDVDVNEVLASRSHN